MSKSYGLILEPPAPEDFSFGADRSLDIKFAGRVVLQPDGDWRGWVPPEEPQAPVYETFACASFGTDNTLEVLLRRQYDRVHDFSDRFVAKGSGTNPNQGNSPRTVAEFIRHNWAAYESEWPAGDAKTAAEFYGEIPQNLKTKSN